MKEEKFRFDMRFTLRVVRHCDRLPREVLGTPKTAVFKTTKQWYSGRCPFSWLRSWDYEIFKVPSNP